MKLSELVATLSPYADDLRANFDGLIVRGREEDRTLVWGTIVASAMVARSATVTRAASADASGVLSTTDLQAARLATISMTLTNHFYRHHALTAQPELQGLRSGLRLTALRRQEKAGAAFKLWCVAVSVLNGCSACVQANQRAAFERGATPQDLARVLRVSALIQAIAVAVETEQALQAGFSRDI